jgi:hypothetical protein
MPEHKKLPNESAVLVLGILSICSCVMWGLPGLVLGIVSLVLYNKDKSIYNTDPAKYERSFKNSNAGRICAIIGVSLSAVTFLFILGYFLIIGSLFFGLASTINESAEYNRNHRNDYYEYNSEELEENDSTLYIDNTSFDSEDTSTVN